MEQQYFNEQEEESTKWFIFNSVCHNWHDHEEGHFEFNYIEEIDIKTLAIHFPSMLDSDNKKIFASLDSDKGIGGDKFMDGYIAVYKNGSIKQTRDKRAFHSLTFKNEKVIGIQK